MHMRCHGNFSSLCLHIDLSCPTEPRPATLIFNVVENPGLVHSHIYIRIMELRFVEILLVGYLIARSNNFWFLINVLL